MRGLCSRALLMLLVQERMLNDLVKLYGSVFWRLRGAIIFVEDFIFFEAQLPKYEYMPIYTGLKISQLKSSFFSCFWKGGQVGIGSRCRGQLGRWCTFCSIHYFFMAVTETVFKEQKIYNKYNYHRGSQNGQLYTAQNTKEYY